MKNCLEYAALLDSFVDGELTAEEAVRVQKHLEACAACRAYVDDALAIRACFPSVEDTEVPEGFAGSVAAAVRESAAPQAAGRRRPEKRRGAAPWARTFLPLAACCAIVSLLTKTPLSASDNASPEAAFHAAPAGMEEPLAAADAAAADGGRDLPQEAEEEGMAIQAQSDLPESAPENEALHNSSTQETANAPEPDLAQRPALRSVEGSGSPSESVESSADTESPAGGAPSPQLSGEAAKNAAEAPSLATLQADEGWVQYGNVVFACVIYLPKEDVGDALDGYEGKPYSNVNHPEEGVTGTGYALEAEDFERILDELEYPVGPVLNQDRTTELRCIVVTES